MGNGFPNDPEICASPPRSSAGADQPRVPTPTAAQMRKAGARYQLHSYSDGCAGLLRMVQDLFGDNDPDSVEALDPATVQSLRHGLYKRSAPAAPTAFYPGMSHQQLYDSVTRSVNPGQLGDMASAWSQSSEELLDASQSSASQVLATSEIAWRGQAGDAARRSVAKLANQAGQAGQAAQVSAQLYQQQSAALAHAKNSIPKPPAQPFNAAAAEQQLATVTDPARYVALAQQDHAQFVAQQQAQQTAARIVQQYDQVVIQTSRNQPAFAPAPQVTKQASRSIPPSAAASGGTASPQGGGFATHPGTGPGGATPSAGAGSRAAGVPTMPATAGPTSVGNSGAHSVDTRTSPSTSDYSPARHLPTSPFGGDPGSVGTPGVGPNVGDVSGGALIAPVGGAGSGGHGAVERAGSGRGVGGGSGGGVADGRVQSGAGARSGAGPAAVERGTAGAAGEAGAGGGMVPGTRGGKRDEDAERRRASYLTEPDPNDIFGTDEKTIPPVIG